MEDKIVLYSTGCPRCRMIEKKLDGAGVRYIRVEDIHLMIVKGMMSAPMLEVNEEIMNYEQASEWIENRKVGA
ncbi:MAG: hypothetical protein WCS17_08190 [Prevotella sp.]